MFCLCNVNCAYYVHACFVDLYALIHTSTQSINARINTHIHTHTRTQTHTHTHTGVIRVRVIRVVYGGQNMHNTFMAQIFT